MKKFILLLSCLWMAIASMANNVVISNISLEGSPGNYRVTFELSWENSWRVSTGQNNYDGVWVFFKYRVGGGDWQHLNMTGVNNTIDDGNMSVFQNSGVTKTGAIIHRNIDGLIDNTGGLQIGLGVSDPVGFNIDIRGYAVEMVFIPQCNDCIIGDGDGVSESTFALHDINGESNTFGTDFRVDVNAIDDATLEAGIVINAAGITGNANFPTGPAMWSMKYELSQGAYRDFLNSLNLVQQTTRTQNAPTSAVGTGALTASGSFRNFIEIATQSVGGAPAVYGLDASGNNVFNEADDGEWVACNFLNWPDVAAYLDWAGLAPMSEIGFERICRGASTAGANASVLGEFAWGSTSIFASTYTLAGTSTAAELASNSSPTLGNANYSGTHPNIGGTFGPLRNGIFATASSNRITSGASFYGVMEMTGNVQETVVTIGNVAGRGFTGINGDGSLSINGNANVSNWPCGTLQTDAPTCSEVINSAGILRKGGSIGNSLSFLPISARNLGQHALTRVGDSGGRGVLYIQ